MKGNCARHSQTSMLQTSSKFTYDAGKAVFRLEVGSVVHVVQRPGGAAGAAVWR